MAVTQRGAISFGLVYIPVELYAATQDEDIRFNQLARETGERVRYQKTCASCKAPLQNSDIVKGFEYDKGKYVVLTDEDFEKIKTEKDRSIQIVMFCKVSEIPPVYFERSFQVVSQAGGEKAFELLRRAMLADGKVAVGRTVMGTKETMLALIPTADGMLLQTLYYASEVREIPRGGARPEVSDAELRMAEQLIDSMSGPFAPEEYRDEYQQRLRALIERKIAGQDVVVPETDEAPRANIVDLMDALKKSLERTGGTDGGAGGPAASGPVADAAAKKTARRGRSS